MNGVQDSGEAGISGVTVKLLNSAGHGGHHDHHRRQRQLSVLEAAAGDHKIQMVTPNGYTITGKDQGGNDAADSDIDSTGTTGVYTLTQGSNNLNVNVDAGFYPRRSPARSVTGVGRRQLQRHPGRGRSRPPMGVTVKLLNSAGTVVATTTTDANGNYLFNNVNAGDYKAGGDPHRLLRHQAGSGRLERHRQRLQRLRLHRHHLLTAGQTLTKVDAGLYRKPASATRCDGLQRQRPTGQR